MRRWTDNLGFTLLEVMIAVTILAGMSLALFGASRQLVGSKAVLESRDDANHAVSFALEKMSDDLQMAYMVKSKDMLGAAFEGEVNFLGAEDRLDFVSFSHVRYLKEAKESESAEISYYLAPDSENPELRILMRRESVQIDKNPQIGGQAFPLLEGVRTMALEYLPHKSDEWKKIWDTQSIDSGNQLPRAVKITLELMMPEQEEAKTFYTIAPIRMKDPLVF